jgi:hypothetical protein
MAVVLNFIGFQVVWFSAIVGAARGSAWWGIAAAAVYLAGHLWHHRKTRQEIVVVVTAIMLGFIGDSLMYASGWLTTPPGMARIEHAPAWLVALWAALGATVRHALGWLRDRLYLAALLGALSGPAAYHAGAVFGALSIDGAMATIAVGIEYALALPVLIWVAHRQPLRKVKSPHQERNG